MVTQLGIFDGLISCIVWHSCTPALVHMLHPVSYCEQHVWPASSVVVELGLPTQQGRVSNTPVQPCQYESPQCTLALHYHTLNARWPVLIKNLPYCCRNHVHNHYIHLCIDVTAEQVAAATTKSLMA